jgi:opacity protein-like surface antigen
MKKVILAALASTVIASSASASFYAGVHGGTDVGRFMSVPEVTDKLTGIKLDRQMNIKGGLEVGYNLMDNLGIGLEVGGYLSPEYSAKLKSTNADFVQYATGYDAAKQTLIKANGFDGVEADTKHKFTIYSGMLKARLDLVDFDVAQIYVNVGAGVGYVSEEYSVATSAISRKAESSSLKGDDYEVAAKTAVTVKMKPAYGLAAAGGLGVAFKLSDSMFLNVGAEYSYMGSTGKEFEDKSEDESKKLSKDGRTVAFAGETKFDAINLVAGIRFNF